MNIILGQHAVEHLRDKYVVLSLDSFRLDHAVDPITSYCVIEQIPMQDMLSLDQWKDLHENLICNYGKRNWSYCEQAIDYLYGRWNRELDSFYDDLLNRIKRLKDLDLGENWSPVIDRRAQDSV